MKKVLLVIAVAIILVFAFVNSSQASPSKQSLSSSGTCFNGSTWTLTMNRSGSQVTTALTVKPMTPKSLWNINYAYPNQFAVANFPATASSKGVLSFKHTLRSASPVYAVILVDTWGVASATTCVAGGTI